MAWVERRVTRTSQPQELVGVAWDNPLSQGTLGAWLGSGGGSAAFGTDAIPQGNAVTKVGIDGIGFSNTSTGSNNFWKIERGTTYTYTEKVTFEAVIEADSFSSVAPYISGVFAQYVQPGSSADDRGPFLRFGNGVNGNQARPYFAIMQSNVERGVMGPAIQTGRKYHLLGTYDGATVKLFIDGVLIGSTAASGAMENGSNAYLALGSDYPGTSSSEFRAFQGRIYLARAYGIGKSDSEALALASNPWQTFQPHIEYVWVDDFIDVGGGATTVTTDASATYTIAGAAQSDRAAQYQISSVVTADAAASYAVRGSTAIDASAAYAVASAVQADASASYAIASAVQQDAATQYAIRAAVTTDASASYSLISATSVTADASASYVVQGSATQDAEAIYAVRAAVFADAVASYALIVDGQVTADASAQYQIRGAVQSDASLAYEIAGAVQASAAGGYVVQAAVSADAVAGYVVRGAVVVVDAVASYLVDGVAIVLQPSIHNAYVPLPRNQAYAPLAANQAYVPTPTNQAYLP